MAPSLYLGNGSLFLGRCPWRASAKEALRDVVRDKLFWHFTLVATLVLMTTGIMTLAIPFWAKYTLHASPKAPALLFFVAFGSAILTVAPWSKMVRKWGTKRMWVWAISIMIMGALELGFANTLLSGLVGALLSGVGLGGVKVCREMLLALFVDRNLSRTGHRREGIYYSLMRFFARLSRINESLSLLLLGVLVGYFSGENPGPHPDNAFRFLMSATPLLFLIGAWIMARRLPLGMEHEQAGA
jgi:GPH family glycoside/pentoside/hexuronide:cation symporter